MDEQEYNLKANAISQKLEVNEELTIDEIKFFCEGTKFQYLSSFSFCDDYYFMRIFLARQAEMPLELIKLEDSDNEFFNAKIAEWDDIIKKTNHHDQNLQITCQETRHELKKFHKQNLINLGDQHKEEKNIILAWSKYRHIRATQIFQFDIKSDEYILTLNEKRIVFSFYSQVHILTRHFAKIMKPYATDKSHFDSIVKHNEIHLFLESIFEIIDKSGIYINDSVEEINIRYNGVIFKIFSQTEKKHVKGKELSYLRLNSFFPVENKEMLNRLKSDFQEKSIDRLLSIFVKKQSIK